MRLAPTWRSPGPTSPSAPGCHRRLSSHLTRMSIKLASLAVMVLTGCQSGPEGRYVGKATGALEEQEGWVMVIRTLRQGYGGELTVAAPTGVEPAAYELRNVVFDGRRVSFNIGELSCVSVLHGLRLKGDCSSEGAPVWHFDTKRVCACAR